MSLKQPLPSLSRILLLICLGVAVLSLIGFALTSRQVRSLTLAAGDPEGESYLLSRAIAQVITANQPRLHITVLSTGGTEENLRLLENGQADLATAQADFPAGSAARSIAVLHRDLFQLVVQRNSGIHTFSDLVGHRILLQPNSGEFYSFLKLALHYGLRLEDFQLVFARGEEADQLFQQQQADALFRVRTLNNQYLMRVVQQASAELLPIEQSDALKIRHPALETGMIPQGGYQGNPPIPATNLPTVAVQQFLLASRSLDTATVREITAVLNENRREIASALPEEHADLRPLVASIKRPSPSAGTGVPQHPGAIAYYERDRPTLLASAFAFLLKNAGLFIAMITLPAGSLIGLWESWQRLKQRADDRRSRAEEFIRVAIQNMEVETATDPRELQKQLQQKQANLEQIFNDAANALVREEISQESFRTFNEAYQTTGAVLQRRIELASEALTDQYIKQLIDLLHVTSSTAPHPVRLPSTAQTELGTLLKQVKTSLMEKEISQGSFRTFIEAYRTTREALREDLPPVQS